MSTDLSSSVETEQDTEAESPAVEDLASQYSASNDSLSSDYEDAHEEDRDDEGGEEESPPEETEKPTAISRQDYADYGLTEDVARELDAKGTLGVVMDAIDRRFLAMGEEALKGETAENATGEEKPETKQPSESNREQKPVEGPLKLTLDPELYNADLVSDLNGFVDHLNRQHAELSRMTEALAGVMQTTQAHAKSLQTQQEAAFAERMDVWFNTMGEEYQDLVGKGTVYDMAPTSPQFQKRSEIVRTMEALARGYERVGDAVPGESVLRERAKRLVLGDRAEEVARKKVTAEAREYREQLSEKPSHRVGKPLGGMDKAVRRVEKFYRDKGLT